MYCTKCGNELLNNAKFCEHCGEKIKTVRKEKKIKELNINSQIFIQEDVRTERKEPQRFSFRMTFIPIFLVSIFFLFLLLLITNTFNEFWREVFIILFLSFSVATMTTLFIKWLKNYKSSNKLISKKINYDLEENDVKPGIRGWLVLVAIGVVLTPITIAYTLFNDFFPLFKENYLDLFVNQNSQYYIPGMGAILMFEIIGNSLLLLVSLFLLFLLFRKDKKFPEFYVVFFTFNFILILLDLVFCFSVFGQLESEDYSELGKVTLSVLIWVPYIMNSKLVKTTFIK